MSPSVSLNGFFFDNARPLKLGAHKRVDRALTNLRGRRLKRKGKEVLGARETRGPGRTRREGKKRRFLLSLLARPLAFLSRLKLPFPSLSNAYHALTREKAFHFAGEQTSLRPINSLAASCLSSMIDPSPLYCLFPFVNGRWRVVHAFYTHCLSVVSSNVSLLKRRKFTSHKSNLIFLFCCSALQHFFHPSLHFYAHPLK